MDMRTAGLGQRQGIESNVVSGDWEWTDFLDAYETGFVADAFGPTWNGAATPILAPTVMESFAHRQSMLRASGMEVDAIRRDGNGYAVVSWEDETDVTYLLPNVDGSFDLSPLGYTFVRLSEDDNVVRTVSHAWTYSREASEWLCTDCQTATDYCTQSDYR